MQLDTPMRVLPKYLTQDELRRFFGMTESFHNRALFPVIYHYGLRMGIRSPNAPLMISTLKAIAYGSRD